MKLRYLYIGEFWNNVYFQIFTKQGDSLNCVKLNFWIFDVDCGQFNQRVARVMRWERNSCLRSASLTSSTVIRSLSFLHPQTRFVLWIWIRLMRFEETIRRTRVQPAEDRSRYTRWNGNGAFYFPQVSPSIWCFPFSDKPWEQYQFNTCPGGGNRVLNRVLNVRRFRNSRVHGHTVNSYGNNRLYYVLPSARGYA